MKKIILIVSLIILLSFTGTSFVNAGWMSGKISGVMHYEIIPQGFDGWYIKAYYDEYINCEGIEVNGVMDMRMSISFEDIMIEFITPYWNPENDIVVGVLSIFISDGQGHHSILHLEANPGNVHTIFIIYSSYIGAYGTWMFDLIGPDAKPIMTEVILPNDKIIFEILLF